MADTSSSGLEPQVPGSAGAAPAIILSIPAPNRSCWIQGAMHIAHR